MVSIFMAIIVLYFNYRTLKLNEKDRERPRVVELIRFVIVPVKEWLTNIGRDYLEEFNLRENLRRWIESPRARASFQVSDAISRSALCKLLRSA